MKNTHFLDKIYNANAREFDRLIIELMKGLEQSKFPYSYFKNNGKWLIEIEKENTLISISFDDYKMFIYNSLKKKGIDYSYFWREIFYKFLHKNQKYYYKKGLQKFENSIDNELIKDL